MKYCPLCQTYIDESESKCSECGYNFNSANHGSELDSKNGSDSKIVPAGIVQPGRRPKIQVLVELATLIDRTGSSKEFEVGIPKAFETIARFVEAKARSVSFYTATHGDKDEGQEFALLTNSATIDQAISDVNDIDYQGGGEAREHHLDALEDLVERIPWGAGPDVRSAAVAFMTSDSKPASSGKSPEQIGKLYRNSNIQLYLVCQPTPTLNSVIEAAEGLMFQISNRPNEDELQQISTGIAKSIEQSFTADRKTKTL